MKTPRGRPRQAGVRALAKLNLDLRVLAKRPDGYHELRTVFQTVSLADSLDLTFTPGRRTSVEIQDPLGIEGNLASKAAQLLLDATGATGEVLIRLTKRIPIGAGLGGGSSDAAAVLLALPVLAGHAVPLTQLAALATTLGSDVPFFLTGGRAVGIGRGSELFPLPDRTTLSGVLIAPGVPVSTPQAYRRLSPHLTSESEQNKIVSFQSLVWDGGVSQEARNDFETVVFEQHPELARLKKRLIQAGALQSLMTGSGSAVFGLFRTGGEARNALDMFKGEPAFRISLVNRTRYRSMWWRALEQHIDQRIWPPRSRYAR